MGATEIRKHVITQLRRGRHGPGMARKKTTEYNPTPRAERFIAWMDREGTNTRQVALKAEVPYTTLASFVQGKTQSLHGAKEEKIARAYDAAVDEIFGGKQEHLVRIVGRVGANPDGEVVMTTAHDVWDFVPIPPGGTSDSVALEVYGHSMRGFADDGSLIYFEFQRTPPTEDMLNYECVVETEDGRVLLKRLLRGSGPGLYDLESANGPTLRDVRVRWAAEPTAIIPARQARRIIRRGGEEAA
jgi:phage repressor protein C with HTH and peptisase S24 domain